MRRWWRAEGGKDCRFLRFDSGEVGLLDVTEAANLERQRGEFHRERVIGGQQAGEELVEDRLVLADQPPFEPPLLATAKDVKACAAEPAQPREDAEELQHPRAKAALAQMPGLGVAVAEQRRRQVEVELVGAFKLLGHAFQEIGLRIK